jgi:phosphoribosylformylglycinamidine synthase
MRVLQHGQVVAEIPNAALTDEAPVYSRPMERWEPPVPREMPEHIRLGDAADLTPQLRQLLANPNICSKRWVHEQYDSMVQVNTVEGPGGGDAGVIRVKGTKRGLAMALDGNGRWCYLDPKLGAMHAVAESARNVACSGATSVAATNCLNFGNPEKPEIMWQFAQVVDGITRACEELEVPITGGNVSFYNETLGEAIYPTPVLGVVGILEDVERAAWPHFREPDRTLLLLRGSEPGDLTDAQAEFGSSEYAKEILGALWGFPPALELEKEAALQKCLIEAIQAGLVDSAHDISEGGLAIKVAECGFRNLVGARLELAAGELPAECLLFGEDASRVVVSCDPHQVQRIQQVAEKYGVAAELIGATIADNLEIVVDGKTVVSAPIKDLRESWSTALERALHTETEERLVPAVLQKS